jgi:hypothetical protein
MKNKTYKCEIEDCQWTGSIRSKIKNRDSEHFGKSCCPIHAKQINNYTENKTVLKRSPIKSSNKPIKKFTKKGMEKRKANREGYGDFFIKHIQIVINEKKVCENCGNKLTGHVSEIAHSLSKGRHPSVALENLNILYLCSPFTSYNSNDCHSKYDRDLVTRASMPVFEIAKERYKLFKDKVKENSKERIILEIN